MIHDRDFLAYSARQPARSETRKERRLRRKAIKRVKKMRRLYLDFETYSEVDLTLVGAELYAEHPTTEVLMLAWALDDGPIQQWLPLKGQPFPKKLRRLLDDPEVILSAWNAPFEMAIFEHTLHIEIAIERWRDTMAMAASMSLPLKLEKAGEVVGLPEDKAKMQRGKLLVRKFTRPRKPTKHLTHTRSTEETDPEDWQEFLDYNVRDVEAERAIYRRTRKWDMPAHEWGYWHLDQKINRAGIPINLKVVDAAIRLRDTVTSRAMKRLKEITGLENPNSNPQLLGWLRENGYPFEDMKKGHIEQALERARAEPETEIERLLGTSDEYREVLELRGIVSKTSLSKYDMLRARTNEDGITRGCFQFAGAGRTWRWSGRGHQPHNPPRPERWTKKILPDLVVKLEKWSPKKWLKKYSPQEIIDILVGCVRPVTQAPFEALLIDADLNAIENRVLGWLARDEKIMRVFREGRCPYVDFATRMFHRSYEELWAKYIGGDDTERTIAKPGVLGCGYMLSAGFEKENPRTGEIEATGLLGYGRNMGVDLTSEMADHSVKVFRQTFEDVVQFWADLDAAVRRLISTGQPQSVGYLKMDYQRPFMRIILPSGRALHYVRPKLKMGKTPWGERRLQITYENMEKGQWRRVSTHPGKLAENVTQAVARDILAHGMWLAWEAAMDIRLHVHDQIVAVVYGGKKKAKKALEKLIGCMAARPWWADKKLPLAADGFVSPVWVKD